MVDREKAVLKSSLKGGLSYIIKNLLLVIIAIGLGYLLNLYRKGMIEKLNGKLTFDSEQMKFILIILLVCIFLLVVIVVLLTLLYRLIVLLYEVRSTTTFDFINGRVIIESTHFLWTKEKDENKLDDIIQVVITQNALDRIFNTGEIYVEYLVNGRKDSKVRKTYIQYVSNPYKAKGKLM